MTEQLPYTHHCFVCGRDNASGLQLRFRSDGDQVEADYAPCEPHTGYPGILHGGIVAAALDEAMFWAATTRTSRMQMSVELSIRYRDKVRIDRRYRLTARVSRSMRGVSVTESQLCDEAGNVCATATGKYLPLPAEEAPRVAADAYPDPETVPFERFIGDG